MLLRRHDLVWLSAQGWDRVMQEAADDQASRCLAHWFGQRLPLVVGRQDLGATELSLGLAAPLQWDKRKLALRAPRACVLYQNCFPRALDVRTLLPFRLRDDWIELCNRLSGLGANPRVYGSYGWQRITQLEYLTRQSDLDLLLSVSDGADADRVAQCLDAFRWEGPRIDGELLFPDGNAVAWREWLRWRRGDAGEVLVKSSHAVALKSDAGWFAPSAVVAA
jgi:phosphoribosyl-dephospho-CoA transferase